MPNVTGPVGSCDNDWTSAETAAARNVGLSLWRGVRRSARATRAANSFVRFSKSTTTDLSPLDSTGHRVDDLPAYLVIVIVGHVLVPVILWIEVDYAPC